MTRAVMALGHDNSELDKKPLFLCRGRLDLSDGPD